MREHEHERVVGERRLAEPMHVIVDDRTEIVGEPLLVELAARRTLAPHDEPAWRFRRNGSICDLRDTLRPSFAVRRLAYTGIAFMNSKIIDFIPDQKACDLIPICLDIIREGKYQIEALIAKGHAWCDMGTVQSYFEAHRDMLIHNKKLIENIDMPDSGVHLLKMLWWRRG